MITHISTVRVFVEDQDRAKAFYTEKLGFHLVNDTPSGSARWVSVKPQGAQTEVILYKTDENWQHYQQVRGKWQALTFEVDGLSTYVDALKAKGVEIVQEVSSEPWGSSAMIRDSEGNILFLTTT